MSHSQLIHINHLINNIINSNNKIKIIILKSKILPIHIIITTKLIIIIIEINLFL